jgi:RNA polymerase sigma-70 factor (ECF subfamily)
MLDGREQERFLRLWADAQPAVAAFVHAVVRDPASAKDVLQETALTLFRRFGDYDGGRPFLAWALGVAKLQVLGFRRDEARSLVTFDSELFDRFTEAWAEQAPSASRHSLALEICLDRMAARPRQLLRWRYQDDLKSEEIARRLGTKGPAVRVTLQRLREQLRECVERQLRTQGRAG